MKSIISTLLMFVALSSCQNLRSYDQLIPDYVQTARALPYASPQSRAAPEPISRSYAPDRQQMRMAAATPTPETIRISFSGLDSNDSPAQSKIEAPTQVKSQYGQERRSTTDEEVPRSEERAAPRQPFIPILRFDQEIQEGVKNRFHFTAANGIEEKEETLIEHLPPGQRNNEYSSNYDNGYGYTSYDNYDYDDVEIVKRGKYSYISPEGQHVQVSWVADKNGFRPVGSHILNASPAPFSVPVPAVRESLPVGQEVPMTRQYPAPQQQ